MVEISIEETQARAQAYAMTLAEVLTQLGIPPGGPATIALLHLAADSFVQGPAPTLQEFMRVAYTMFEERWRARRMAGQQ